MSFFLKAVFVFIVFMLLARAAPVFALVGGGGPAGIPLIEYMFARVVCVAVPLGYTALLVVLIIAGIKYLTSGGEPKAISQAHQTVTWGLLGILFLALAWLILLLIQNFTGVEVTKFSLSSLPGVQGFSGQCLGPAPIAPEPPKQTVQTTPQAKEVCTDDKKWFKPIPISQTLLTPIIYRGTDDITELGNVFPAPIPILVMAGATDTQNVYEPIGDAIYYFSYGYGGYYAKFDKSGHGLEEFKRTIAVASDTALRILERHNQASAFGVWGGFCGTG